MSRRDIRRMLMEPKNRVTDRRWILLALMAVVLAAGLGIGVTIGKLAGDKVKPAAIAAQDEVEFTPQDMDRAPRREDQPVPTDVAPPPVIAFTPIVPLPSPRPGGPADDGMVDAMEAEVTAPSPAPTVPPTPNEEPPALTVPLILPQPPVAPVNPGAPAWKRHAVAAPRTAGLPVIAVVIDDMGVDRRNTDKVMQLRAPLTLSFLTYADDLGRLTEIAHKRGHELMLHVPMEPQGEKYDPGRDVLEVGLNPEEIRRRLNWGLDRFDGFVGINNHMGSRFTADSVGMRVVMEELRKRGLLFLDSVTTEKSVGPDLAKRYGVPFVARNVFIDNDGNVAAVRAQLAKAEAHARKHGAAIAIGHPRDATVEALAAWLPGLEARGVVLVPVTAIVKGKPAS